MVDADDADVAEALAFLRKHDVSHTGAPVLPHHDLPAVDIEDIDSFIEQPIGHQPVGPNWKKPGSTVQLPRLPNHPTDNAWLIHERQDQTGKYKAWLFFSLSTGDYYIRDESGKGYTKMGQPHDPRDVPISVRVGNANVLGRSSGSKLELAVLLPDLHKTGFLLKQPLEFLDKPASLFVLCAGLRNTAQASEFCAKRFHTLALPKLSSRATVWYDYELTEVLRSSVAALDALLLEAPACFAGCSLAIALVIGSRLVIGTVGGVRCLLCSPGKPAAAGGSAKAAVAAPWTARPVAGGATEHTLANKDERGRIESESGMSLGDGEEARLHAFSASASTLAAISDDWERESLRAARATSSFATLGVTPAELKEGAAGIRRIFRRRSLIVHPDKVVEEDRRQRTAAVFAKLEAAAASLEAMLLADAAATQLLAEIHGAYDEGRLGADPAVAARLLGVREGCDQKAAKAASRKKFDAPLSKLQAAARQDVGRAMKILDVAVSCVARGTVLWTPAEADAGVRVTRALGCRDLKKPLQLMKHDLVAEVVPLELGETLGLALVADSKNAVADDDVARRMGEHAPGRPRAAALRIVLDGAAAAGGGAAEPRPQEGISVVCAYFRGEAQSSGGGPPPAKKARGPGATASVASSARPARVRVSHVLLRWVDLRGEDEFRRPGMLPATRTQAEAERELLELMEELLAARDPKTLAARFKAEVLKRSECSTALNVPYADLGWMEPGGAEQPLEAAAFDTPVGGLSDVVLSSRGAHLMYRLA